VTPPDEMEQFLDDLVEQIVQEAMTQGIEDGSAQDLRAALAEVRDFSRRRIEEAADNFPVDDLRLLFCLMIDRAVKAKVEELLQVAFPQSFIEHGTN